MNDRTTCACGATSLPCGCCHDGCACEAHRIQNTDRTRAILTDAIVAAALALATGFIIGRAFFATFVA